MRSRGVAFALAVLFVLGVYVFFGSAGTLEFRRTTWEGAKGRPGQGYYHSLAEGFLRGQLAMADRPDPKLMALPHPYDFQGRYRAGAKSIFDASYLNGRYYLYFTPLPVVLFYIPFRLVSGLYPSDALAATFFCAWAFLMAAAFVRRALAGAKLHVPLPLWIALLGLGNLVPFFLPEPKVYENAIFAGMAMSATWAWALLRFLEAPTGPRAAVMTAFLALAIAARPNLAVLLVVAMLAIFCHPERSRGTLAGGASSASPRTQVPRLTLGMTAMLPLLLIGGAVASYNYARFGNPLEYGQRYQLTFVAMEEHRICGVCNFPEVVRVVNSATHYLFWAPAFSSRFPFVNLRTSVLDPAASFPSGGEQIVGLAPLVPLALAGSLFAVLLWLRGGTPDAGERAARLLIAGAWLTLFALTTCWWVTGRYSLDFLVVMTAGAIVCIERGLSWLATAGVRVLALRIVVVLLACFSIVTGTLLGFQGVAGGFERVNPDLFRRLSERASVSSPAVSGTPR